MAEITSRRQGEMIQTLFQVLETEPEGLQGKDAIATVESRLELTAFEKSTFPKNPDVARPEDPALFGLREWRMESDR